MKKLTKLFCMLLLPIILIVSLSACSDVEDDLVGKWYKDEEKCLDIRSDGTWKIEGMYGTGTWKILDDGETIEFLDFYGESCETYVDEDEYGEFVTLDYMGYVGNYYKDSPPSSEKSETDNSSMSDTTAPTTNDTPTHTEDSSVNDTVHNNYSDKTVIDPFKGLNYEISGISPYCKITLNNAACSEEAQLYVTYTLDKEDYSNGEYFVVTATLSEEAENMNMIILDQQAKYPVENQPEYIESLDGVDLTMMYQELTDTINTEIAQALSNRASGSLYVYLFDNNIKGLSSVDKITPCETYLSTLKLIKKSEYHNCNAPYNKLSFIYSISYTDRNSDKVTYWTNISTVNIIKYPNGTLKWGYESSDSYDFKFSDSGVSLENCVLVTVTIDGDWYNVSKVQTENE